MLLICFSIKYWSNISKDLTLWYLLTINSYNPFISTPTSTFTKLTFALTLPDSLYFSIRHLSKKIASVINRPSIKPKVMQECWKLNTSFANPLPIRTPFSGYYLCLIKIATTTKCWKLNTRFLNQKYKNHWQYSVNFQLYYHI